MSTEDENTFEDEFGLDVQKKFIALLLFDQAWSVINGFEIVRPEYFENKILSRICKWIHEYYTENKAMPTKLILLEKAKDFINDTKGITAREYFLYQSALDDIYNNEDKHTELNFFKEKAVIYVKQIKWKKALEEAGKAGTILNYEQAVNKFKEILSFDTDGDIGLDFNDMDEDVFIKDLREAYDPKNMIKTGIPDWDKALGGGFVKNNLHIIGAPPGGGKSKTMAYLATQAIKDNKKIIFISLELDEKDTMANIKSSATGMTLFDLIDPKNLEVYKNKITAFKANFGPNLIVKFYPPATVTADTIYNYIQKVIQAKKEKEGMNWKPDAIFLDYLDKLLPTQKVKGSLYEDVGGIADDCKNLAISYQCPVITGSQLGKVTWNLTGSQVVNLDSLAESSRKAHLAHTITTINYNQAERALGKARLFTAKSRSGQPNKTIYIEQNLGKCLITQADPWDPSTLQSTETYTIKNGQNT